MSTLKFTEDGQLEDREYSVGCEGKPPKLPSVEQFKLNNIIANVEESKTIRHELATSILRINDNYTADLDDQIRQIRGIEKTDILDRMDTISDMYTELGRVAQREKERREQSYSTVLTEMAEINSMMMVSKDRIDTVISHLKACEHRLAMKDRLFNLKSSYEDHYRELYDYGMKEELEEERQRERSTSLGTSPVKIAQYMRLEHEIEQIAHEKEPVPPKIFNPGPAAPTITDTGDQATAEAANSDWGDELRQIVTKKSLSK